MNNDHRLLMEEYYAIDVEEDRGAELRSFLNRITREELNLLQIQLWEDEFEAYDSSELRQTILQYFIHGCPPLSVYSDDELRGEIWDAATDGDYGPWKEGNEE